MSTSSAVCLVGVGESACWELIGDFLLNITSCIGIDEFLTQRGIYTQATSVVGTLQVVRRAFTGTVNSSSRHL